MLVIWSNSVLKTLAHNLHNLHREHLFLNAFAGCLHNSVFKVTVIECLETFKSNNSIMFAKLKKLNVPLTFG